MQARDRALNFLKGERVDRIPVHPLVMQYAARKAGVPYGAYCRDHRRQAEAMLWLHERLGLEYIHPAGFPYCESEAYGMRIVYPEDGMPRPEAHLVTDIREIDRIRPVDMESCRAVMNRVEGVALYRRTVGDGAFLSGHCEGPLAEYTDLRGVSEGFMDLCDHEEEVKAALKIIAGNARQFMRLQIEAGAECMSIGDAVCSQIGPSMYRSFVKPLHKALIEYAHSLGAVVKLHICGDTTPILPDLVEIGTDIIDIDWMVDFQGALPMLRPGQAFCGNIDPVSVLLQGTPDDVRRGVHAYIEATNGRCIVGSGCEVPPNTPDANYRALVESTLAPSPAPIG